MSASSELQKMIYDRLLSDAGVSALVAGRVYDRRPKDADYPCVTFGPSDYVTEDAECITGRLESIQIDCWWRDGGILWPCRQLTDAVKAALHLFDGVPASSRLVIMRVEMVRVFLDPDGITAHGVVMVEADIEEA